MVPNFRLTIEYAALEIVVVGSIVRIYAKAGENTKGHRDDRLNEAKSGINGSYLAHFTYDVNPKSSSNDKYCSQGTNQRPVN